MQHLQIQRNICALYAMSAADSDQRYNQQNALPFAATGLPQATTAC